MEVIVTVRVYAWQHPDLVAFAENPANHAGLALKDCIRAYVARDETLLIRPSGSPKPCASRMQSIHCRLNTKTDPEACELYRSMTKYGTKASFLRRLLCHYIAPQAEPYVAFDPALMGLTGAAAEERPGRDEQDGKPAVQGAAIRKHAAAAGQASRAKGRAGKQPADNARDGQTATGSGRQKDTDTQKAKPRKAAVRKPDASEFGKASGAKQPNRKASETEKTPDIGKASGNASELRKTAVQDGMDCRPDRAPGRDLPAENAQADINKETTAKPNTKPDTEAVSMDNDPLAVWDDMFAF